MPRLATILAGDPWLWRKRLADMGVFETNPVRVLPWVYAWFADQLPVDDQPAAFKWKPEFLDWLDGDVTIDELNQKRVAEERREQADQQTGRPGPKIVKGTRVQSAQQGDQLLALMRAANQKTPEN